MISIGSCPTCCILAILFFALARTLCKQCYIDLPPTKISHVVDHLLQNFLNRWHVLFQILVWHEYFNAHFQKCLQLLCCCSPLASFLHLAHLVHLLILIASIDFSLLVYTYCIQCNPKLVCSTNLQIEFLTKISV
jgi:hypothetical protein